MHSCLGVETQLRTLGPLNHVWTPKALPPKNAVENIPLTCLQRNHLQNQSEFRSSSFSWPHKSTTKITFLHFRHFLFTHHRRSSSTTSLIQPLIMLLYFPLSPCVALVDVLYLGVTCKRLTPATRKQWSEGTTEAMLDEAEKRRAYHYWMAEAVGWRYWLVCELVLRYATVVRLMRMMLIIMVMIVCSRNGWSVVGVTF